MVYCASTLSLSVLECFVHVDPSDLPDDLLALEAELPDDAFATLDRAKLPKAWRAVPAPAALQEIGEEWVRSGRSAALIVPSAVLPAEVNVLLNPAHADLAKLVRVSAQPFAFDPRLRR
jgi:RES domain-containing protein